MNSPKLRSLLLVSIFSAFGLIWLWKYRVSSATGLHLDWLEYWQPRL